ncbi:hypothetical protein Bbelb_132140 [Branchiostoma belcheri]|nr:hypothetical protein Bbelb_132140 [Branchiostoma belcheri]
MVLTAKKPSAPAQTPKFDEPIALTNLEAEFDRRASHDNQIFSEEFSALPRTLGREHAEAYYSDFNMEKNRFKNIIAYDNARVQLTPISDTPGSDYIHASYMDGYSVARKFIAAQGPLPNTVNDFWRMIWETKSKAIVMVTNLKENNKQKCTQYWPDSGKQSYGDIDVTIVDTIPMVDQLTRIFLVTKESTAGVAGSASRPANNNSPLARVSSWSPNFTGPTGPHSTGKGTLQGLARCDPRCLIEASRGDRHALPPHCLREARRALPSGGSMYARRSAGAAAQDPLCLFITNNQEGVRGRRQVTQFHFLGWPDYGLPQSPMGLLKFHRTVVTKTTAKDTPIVVHCR